MSRSLLILVVTIIVVAAGYYGFSRFATQSVPARVTQDYGQALSSSAGPPATSNAASSAPPVPSSVASTPQAAPSSGSSIAVPGTFSIAISKAHPPAPSDVIRVKKDDQVTLSITTDRAGHLEVHGYRKEVKVEPGTTATMSFAAVRTGRFPIDLHGSDGAHVEVTALEVLPR